MNKAHTIRRISRILRVLMYILAFIGLLMVLRRILAMEGLIPSFTPKGGPAFDKDFARYPFITFLHILPGAVFMILGPLQFIPVIRERYTRFYRVSGRIFLSAAFVVGISAILMPFIMLPIGGVNEAAASLLFAIVFLICLCKTGFYRRKGDPVLYREWLIRAFAIGLAISTIRPIIGLFFAFSGLPPQVFFGTAFWIGFTLHLILAEVWINYTRA